MKEREQEFVTLREVIASWDVDAMLNERSIKHLVMEQADLGKIMEQTGKSIELIQAKFKEVQSLFAKAKELAVDPKPSTSLIDGWLKEAEESIETHIKSYALNLTNEKKLKALAISSQKLIDEYNNFISAIKETFVYLNKVLKAVGDKAKTSIASKLGQDDLDKLKQNIQKIFNKYIQPDAGVFKFFDAIKNLFKGIKEFPRFIKEVFEEMVELLFSIDLSKLGQFEGAVPDKNPEVNVSTEAIAKASGEGSGSEGSGTEGGSKGGNVTDEKSVDAIQNAGSEALKSKERPVDAINKMIDAWAKESNYDQDDKKMKKIKKLKSNIGTEFNTIASNAEKVIEKLVDKWLEDSNVVKKDHKNAKQALRAIVPKIARALIGQQNESHSRMTVRDVKKFVDNYMNSHFSNQKIIKENLIGKLQKEHISHINFERINRLAGLED